MNHMDLVYRQTAVNGATGFELLVPLFDRMAEDLRRAAEAQCARDLERRAREVNHALAIVGFLENWIDPESGELARQLSEFYGGLRHGILQAQAKQSPEMLEAEMKAILGLREVWQRLAHGAAPSRPEILTPALPQIYPGVAAVQSEPVQFSWTA